LKRKKILIFSSKGGGGHLSATAAISAYLCQDYDLETAYIFDDVLGVIDPFKIVSRGRYSAEAFYNSCLRNRWTRLINTFTFAAHYLFQCSFFGTLINNFIIQKKPDLIISVVPLLNGLIESSCQTSAIPFLVVPTDLDVRTFIYAMKHTCDEKVKIALAFDDSLILQSFSGANIPKRKVYLMGFPIKPSFFIPQHESCIKEDFGVPENKPVILLLMGAVGSQSMVYIVQELVKIPIAAHILICLGSNEALRKYLEPFPLPSHISCSIISQTDRIADLMSIASLCITKSGTVSLCETLYKQVPMIIDAISKPPLWEKFNHSFVEHHGFGEVVRNYKELRESVERILTQTAYANTIRKNLANFEKLHFGTNIKQVVETMMN
jgi:processive 1,2-diacylglycerol beta-glucosyltransferase